LSSVAVPNIRLEPVKYIESYAGDTKTVMVVDDDAYHRGLISEILSPLGFLVLEAPDALACSNDKSLNEVDLFLLDISMPGMNGWLLLESLRNKGIRVPIIMVSADAYESPAESTAGHNKVHDYDDYITKPVRDSILLDKVANALNLIWQYELNEKKIICPEPVHRATGINQVLSYDGVTEGDFRELISMAEVGFIEGMDKVLKRIEEAGGAESFVAMIRSCLERYQFAEIISVSKKGLA
jgi:CheY-like chemotaxis protein